MGDLAAFLGQLLAGRLRTVPARDARTRLMLHSLAGRVAELVPGTAEDVVRAVRELGLRWQAACEADVPLIERLLGERTVVDLTRAVPDLAATGTPRSRPRSSPPLIVLPAGAGGGVSRVVAELVEADRS